MQLSEADGKNFWPLYREYRAAMDSVGDALVKLKKFAKVLAASKALRLAQMENRLDVVFRQQMAGVIPLVPAQAK